MRTTATAHSHGIRHNTSAPAAAGPYRSRVANSSVHKELEMAVKTSAMRVSWRIGKSRRERSPGMAL